MHLYNILIHLSLSHYCFYLGRYIQTYTICFMDREATPWFFVEELVGYFQA